MTALFDQVIFGPVRSRRLGLSLGVNLLPVDAKLCSFDCIYCECGWNKDHPATHSRSLPHRVIRDQLEVALEHMVAAGTPPDVITFAGNGEPTLYSEFEAVINDTIALRDRLAPETKISVLTNATRIHDPGVYLALLRVDYPILKLDSAFDETIRRINRPQNPRFGVFPFEVSRLVELMKHFKGEIILQTMFLRGTCDGEPIDNTTEREVSAWLKLVDEIRPRQVMVYSLDRDTPCQTLEKVGRDELQQIAARVEALGIPCSVA